jgi:5-methylcytosine-specific restriction endonuclease McrA
MLWDNDTDSKRTLGIRDKQILYRNAKGKCENPACGKKIEFDEMQVGHKTAWSKGGRTTLKNSVCLCYRCNKLQGTDSWATFMKKQNVVDPKTKLKSTLKVSC